MMKLLASLTAVFILLTANGLCDQVGQDVLLLSQYRDSFRDAVQDPIPQGCTWVQVTVDPKELFRPKAGNTFVAIDHGAVEAVGAGQQTVRITPDGDNFLKATAQGIETSRSDAATTIGFTRDTRRLPITTVGVLEGSVLVENRFGEKHKIEAGGAEKANIIVTYPNFDNLFHHENKIPVEQWAKTSMLQAVDVQDPSPLGATTAVYQLILAQPQHALLTEIDLPDYDRDGPVYV